MSLGLKDTSPLTIEDVVRLQRQINSPLLNRCLLTIETLQLETMVLKDLYRVCVDNKNKLDMEVNHK